MAWYYGEFSCGCEGRVNVIGPTKDRQWKVDKKFAGLCEECFNKKLEEEREQANRKSLEKAKEMELPELTGSEKQIAWANTLRQQLIEKAENINIDNAALKILLKEVDKEGLMLLLDHMLITETESKFYIENRGISDLSFSKILGSYYDEVFKKEEVELEKKIEKELMDEATIIPENSKFNGTVKIKIEDEKVILDYEKNDTFIEIVKSYGFTWNKYWSRNTNIYTGSSEDRAAEIGNALLQEGFTIYIDDEKIREKAINGTYERECLRWIKYSKVKERFLIYWYGKDDKMYKTSRKLPSSKWENGHTTVKLDYYEEVEEFARIYGFKFSDLALEIKEQYEKELMKKEKIKVAAVEKEIATDGLKDILNSSRNVINDLMEED